jgi:hypothetical protein
MSQENVELARGCYDAFQRGDLETALEPFGEAFVMGRTRRAPTRRNTGVVRAL